MNDILEEMKYILNGQVHSNREILNHKGKSLVYWLINCVISIFFFGNLFSTKCSPHFLSCML